MKLQYILLLSLLVLLPFSFLYSQEGRVEELYKNLYDENTAISEDQKYEETYSAPTDDNTLYIIQKIEFQVKGRSKPFALMYHGKFREDEEIIGKENLERYIALKIQLLMNQRVLEEVRIDHFIGEADETGAFPVKLVVYVKDTWNFIVLPYPKFDSNDGFSITLKARDYNFLGAMSPLKLDFGFARESDGDKTFNFLLDSDTPFSLFGLRWNLNFDNEIGFTIGKPLYYQNVTGLSVDLPWRITTFNFGFNHYVTVNEEVDDEAKDLYGATGDFYDPYGSAEFYANWEIPLGFSAGNFGDISYTPKISTRFNYPVSKQYDHRKPVISFSNTIGFGRTDWIGNFRKELSASISNSYNWYLNRSDAPLDIDINATGTVHWPFNKYIGISSRLNYYQKWQWSAKNDKWLPNYSAGNMIRGVIDRDLQADLMLSLNLDFTIRLLRFWPSEWFNKPKLRFFNFELYISPFLDLALLKGPYNYLKQNPYEGTDFNFKDIVAGFGLELILYPGFFRSLRLRVSLGYNNYYSTDHCCFVHFISGIPKKGGFFPEWSELYIGLDLFY